MKQMLLFFLAICMMGITMFIAITMMGSGDVDFDSEFSTESVSTEYDNNGYDEADESESMSTAFEEAEDAEVVEEAEDAKKGSGKVFTEMAGINQFIDDYYEVSLETLTNLEEYSNVKYTVRSGRCELELTNFNTEDSGDFTVFFKFDNLEDDEIEPIIATCFRVFGMEDEDVEYLLDDFDTENTLRYEFDEEYLEEHYEDRIEVDFKPTRKTLNYRGSLSDVEPGEITIRCYDYIH